MMELVLLEAVFGIIFYSRKLTSNDINMKELVTNEDHGHVTDHKFLLNTFFIT